MPLRLAYLAAGLTVLSAGLPFAICQETKPAFAQAWPWKPPEGAVFPGREWEKLKSPAIAGFSSAKLDALRVWLKTQNTTGLMVVVGGYVLFEYGDVARVTMGVGCGHSLT